MAKQSGKGDIESQLDRLGQLLDELPEGRREAFFKWIEEADPTPPGATQAPQVASPGAAPSQGAIRLVGKKRSTSVALSEPLLSALKEYSLHQGTRLSISALVEFLIWQFLGSPTDLIDKTLQAYRPRGVNVRDPMNDMFLEEIGNQCIEALGVTIGSTINNDNDKAED